MKMFINMTKPSPVMAALAEMQGKFFHNFFFLVKKEVTKSCVSECQ